MNIGSGAVYNQNCGNAKEMSRRFSMWLTISVSFLCDLVIIGLIFLNQEQTAARIESVEQEAAENIGASNAKFIQIVQNSAETHKEMMAQAKEGTIWLLRDDIMKTIDFHEATKTITKKQYRRIKDEFDYYTSIGGNHDVKDRWDSFNVKILSNEISITKDGIK